MVVNLRISCSYFIEGTVLRRNDLTSKIRRKECDPEDGYRKKVHGAPTVLKRYPRREGVGAEVEMIQLPTPKKTINIFSLGENGRKGTTTVMH